MAKDYRGTYVIWGPPGTGKTTRLAKSVRRIVETHAGQGLPAMVCSLTRAAAAEAAGRDMPLPAGSVGTLHSHAYNAVDRPPMVKPQDFNEAHGAHAISAASLDADDPYGSSGRESPGDEAHRHYQLLRARMVDRRLWPERVTRFAAAWESHKAATGQIDFGDQIDLALHETDHAPGMPSVILADEAQDHSALEMALLRHWAKPADALIAIGDARQALYCWRGADPALFTDPSIPLDHRDVLVQSWRVPRAPFTVAEQWATKLSDWTPVGWQPRDAEGEVLRLNATYRYPEPLIPWIEGRLAAGRSCIVTAACGYLLYPLLTVLRRQAVPFGNPWRIKRGDWNPLVRRRGTTMADRLLALLRPLEGSDAESPDSFAFGANVGAPRNGCPWSAKELLAWTEPLRSRDVLATGAKAWLKSIVDAQAKAGEGAPDVALDLPAVFPGVNDRALLDKVTRSEGTIVETVHWWLDRMLGSRRERAKYPAAVIRQHGLGALRRPPGLYNGRLEGLAVGTIHSFKGAEADDVVLFPDLSASGMRAWWRGGASRDAVVRQFYVGFTRCRNTLAVCRQASPAAVEVPNDE